MGNIYEIFLRAFSDDCGRSIAVADREKILFASSLLEEQAGTSLKDKPIEAVFDSEALDRMKGVFEAGLRSVFCTTVFGTDFYAEARPVDGYCMVTFYKQKESKDDNLPVEIINNISRELKAQLTMVFSSFQLFSGEDRKLLPEKYASGISILKQQSCRLMRLTSNLIEVTAGRSDSDAGFAPEIDDLGNICRDICEEIEVHIAPLGAKLRFEQPETRIYIPFDHVMVKRIILNLVSNSIRHGGRDVEISVSVYMSGKDAIIRVSDNGKGIKGEIMPYVFNRAFQPATHNTDGAGLGLSIVRIAAELHGGHVVLESKENLTSVYVCLPASHGGSDGNGLIGGPSPIYTGGLSQILIELSDVLSSEEYE